MKTKEAIDCIKDKYKDVWLEGNCRIGQKELLNERDEVIYLLQRGEVCKEHYEKGEEDFKILAFQHSKLWKENSINKKYKQIIKELKEFYGNGILENEGGVGVQLKNVIEILEGKYFPKEIIEEVVKGITEQIKEGAEIARKEAKQDYPESEEWN